MTTPKKASTRPLRTRLTKEHIRRNLLLIVVSLYVVVSAVVIALAHLYHRSLEWLVYVLLVIGAGGIAVSGARWLLDSGARRMAGDLPPLTRKEHDELTPKDRLELTNTTRQTIVQAATALAVILGATFTAGGLIYTARTLKTTQQEQITDRYTRAVEQLGSNKLDVRLGGIYALERLAHDSPPDAPTVANVLSAYIREHSRSGPAPRRNPSPKGRKEIGQYELAADVEAALTVLRQRNIGSTIDEMDLHGARIPGVAMDNESRNLDLSGADLREVYFGRTRDTDFSYTELNAEFSHANLQRARFYHVKAEDVTQFDQADLRHAYIWVTDLSLADLTQADLRDAELINVDFTNALLQKINLQGAHLDRVNLFGATLDHADLRGVDLSKTSGLTRAQLSAAITDRTTKLPSGLGWHRQADRRWDWRMGTPMIRGRIVRTIVFIGLSYLLLLGVAVMLVPNLVYPSLSAQDLTGVSSADKRLELQHARYQLQSQTRGQAVQGLAVLFVVVGAIAAWQQIRVAREGQITERFTRAIDQLGSDKLDVRIGGLYALERIAKNSVEDRPTIQRVLGAFVRSHASWPVGSPDGPEHPSATVDETLPWLQIRAPDVQAAAFILGRRPPAKDAPVLYLSRVDLRSADLTRAQLAGARMRHANLARAWMPHTMLDRAQLNHADLRRANLQGARMSGADLRGAYLQGAKLGRAVLRNADLRGANLRNAELEDSDLTGAQHDAATVWPEKYTP